jgi:signal transduction histidine kinase
VADQNELLHAIIGSMNEGVVVLAGDGRIVLCNPAAAPLLPFPTDEARGREAAEVTLVAGPVGRLEPGAELTLRDLREQRQDVLVPRDDRVFAAAARPVTAASDAPAGAVVVFHDVTGDRAHARELSSFAGVVAHDLLNPIGAVAGWADMLADSLGATAERSPELRMVERIRATSARMEALVRDLLADARAQDRRLNLGTVDLAALAHEVVTSRGCEDVVDVDELPLVRGDVVLLRQLLDNLVGNAVKYVRPGEQPEVRVTGNLQGQDVVVQVCDRGLGIPEGEHDLVFRRFHRAHPDAHPGTGLGLAICRSIAERHGGGIRAVPRTDGPGTVFEVTLPAAEQPARLPA